ncbi:hypothetical protein ES703_32914 [subsurface metagenome]
MKLHLEIRGILRIHKAAGGKGLTVVAIAVKVPGFFIRLGQITVVDV